MNRLIPAVILFCLLSPLVNAQQLSLTDQFMTKNAYGRNNLRTADIQGSPYLDNEYKVGTVRTVDDVLYKDIPLKYNCYDDVLEFQRNNVSYDLKPKTIVKRAEFGGQVFAYKDFESNGGTDKSYFKLLAEGKASLCVRFSVKFYEQEPLKAYAEPKPARFDNLEETYYVSIDNSPAKKILNNKKLIEILADKKNEVESFMSKQKLSARKAEDLIKIIRYYNSL